MASSYCYYTTEEKVFIVKQYYLNQESPTEVIRKFKSEFGRNSTLSPSSVLRIIQKFNASGSVLDDPLHQKGRKPVVTDPETVEEVRQLFDEFPQTSTRRAAQILSDRRQISHTTIHHILKSIDMFPYKIQITQKLGKYDIERRFDFANDVIQKIDTGAIDINKIWFSDEAHFWLEGYVNKQNCRQWGTQKPEFSVAVPLHSKRVTVWCAMSANAIIGPIFLEESVTGIVYLDKCIEPFIEIVDGMGKIDNYWFQQDGARAHRTMDVLDRIQKCFEDRVIGLDFPEKTGSGIDWPPYSPDLTPLDFFLWGYCKDRVYTNNPKNLIELKDSITHVISTISQDMLKRVSDGFEKRLRHLIANGGGTFENLIS
ncbi:uncharacterized protein LOC128958250 [Oppia nitens]|uniref:uncharacterized protein LOC128958250 n=1 Tax=Oppia nitens TaxID=1686743 RepID=UPI0023DAB91A|nr:uncharacterized protein LOC128958250 [Oppia nitens]